MKIIKKPVFNHIKCNRCGCIFKPNIKDIKEDYCSNLYVECPICGHRAYDNLEKNRFFIEGV